MFWRSWVESKHRVLDGHFFTLICCKNGVNVCLKKTENRQKRAWMANKKVCNEWYPIFNAVGT